MEKLLVHDLAGFWMIAAAVLVVIAAAAKGVAASNGQYWLEPRGTHRKGTPTPDKLAEMKKTAAAIVNWADATAHATGILATIPALFLVLGKL